MKIFEDTVNTVMLYLIRKDLRVKLNVFKTLQEDDMAPQNLSFIETESEKEEKNGSGGTSDERDAGGRGRESRSITPSDPLKRLPERLSQLNISSGSKTYRVHNNSASTPSQSEKEQSPSPTRNTRPTISSTFKQSRRSGSAEPGQPGAGMASGPSSLRSNSGAGRGFFMSDSVFCSTYSYSNSNFGPSRALTSLSVTP